MATEGITLNLLGVNVMERPITGDRVLVYDNEPTTGARMTALFAIGTFAFSLFLSWFVFTHMAWNGELAPVMRRGIWAAVIALGGAAFLGWAWLHNRKVTSRIYYRQSSEMLELEHPTLFGSDTRQVALSQVENADFTSGDPKGENRVNAPYVRIGVHHGRAFIVNLPGHIHRYDVFSRVLERAGFDPTVAMQKQAVVETHG
jgi:hypothetical protein